MKKQNPLVPHKFWKVLLFMIFGDIFLDDNKQEDEN